MVLNAITLLAEAFGVAALFGNTLVKILGCVKTELMIGIVLVKAKKREYSGIFLQFLCY
jgi:hypothetical protein